MTAPVPTSVDPDPPPAPGRRTWRRSAVLVTAVVLVVVGAAWVLDSVTGDDPGAGTTTGTGGDDDPDTLLDLADTARSTPGADEPAPDFSVRTFGGGDFTLSNHLADDGRPVILNLWASWCLPCRAEMPLLDEFAAANPEVQVLGVAVRDDPTAAGDFAAEIGVEYLLGYDEKEEVDAAYRALGLPATFWIDPDGVIVKRMFGAVTEEDLAEGAALAGDAG
jgi:thiol-disulfide isomerase/thioredoxin